MRKKAEEIFKDNRVNIVDTTLRDGEQSAGIVFANEEKIQIAKLLDEIGVHQIEVGIPAMEGDEKETIKRITSLNLKASILGWNRALIQDVEHSLECSVDAVCLSISTSDIHIQYKLQKDRAWVLKKVEEATKFSKSHGLYVSVNAEDSSRAEESFLLEFAKVAKDSGADRLRFCDTLGLLNPLQTYNKIRKLIETVNIPIEMHTHNDFGMATANLIAGIEAGATFANTTVNGLGERTGNAALEEVVMALKYTMGIECGIDTRRFREISEYVALASGREIPDWKPIVGNNVFAHEAGIHTDGMYKDPRNYEIFSPEEVGGTRRIVLGKHSGTSTIHHMLKEEGIEVDQIDAAAILHRVRRLAISLKRSLSKKELLYIYKSYTEEKK